MSFSVRALKGMSRDAGVGAIFALVGAVVGALLSFFPTYLFSLKETADRNASVVVLLQAESRQMIAFCSKFNGEIINNPSQVSALEVPANSAWSVASTQGDFVGAVTADEWQTISNAYSSLDNLRAVAQQYDTFVFTQTALRAYRADVKSLDHNLEERCAATISSFQQLQNRLEPLHARLESRSGR